MSDDLCRVAGTPGCGEFVSSVGPLTSQTHAGQSFQAGTVLQAGRTARRLAQEQPVEGGPAAGFKIGLVPHRISNRWITGVRQGVGRQEWVSPDPS